MSEGRGSRPREGKGCWPSAEAGRQAGQKSSPRPLRKDCPHPQQLLSGLWPPDLEVNTFLLLSATLCGVPGYRSPGKLRLGETTFAEQWKQNQVVECGRKSKYPNEKKIGINRAGVTLIWYKQKGHFRSVWRFLSVTNNIFIVLPRVCVCVCVCVCTHVHTHNYLWPQRLKPTRFLWPWAFPGKNTGVGCHFLLSGIKPALAGRFFTTVPPGKLYHMERKKKISPGFERVVNIMI